MPSSTSRVDAGAEDEDDAGTVDDTGASDRAAIAASKSAGSSSGSATVGLARMALEMHVMAALRLRSRAGPSAKAHAASHSWLAYSVALTSSMSADVDDGADSRSPAPSKMSKMRPMLCAEGVVMQSGVTEGG
jgi:hypothetical protein